MPELPEVETIKCTLEKKLLHLSIRTVEIFLPKVVRTPAPEEFTSMLADKTFVGLGRRGKYLLLYLSSDLVLVIHLRMTGQLVHSAPDTPRGPYTHILFHLSNGSELRFSDMRQFGRIHLVQTSQLEELPQLKVLGMEPLSREFTREYLQVELHRRRRRLKPLLLDQTFIAGLGNIYSDEVLFRARLHPQKLSNTLTSWQAACLFRAIQEVLQESIENNGTTLKDYLDGEGKAGNFQNMLKVHNREGQPCLCCKKPVLRTRIGGRSTYFCQYCQKT